MKGNNLNRSTWKCLYMASFSAPRDLGVVLCYKPQQCSSAPKMHINGAYPRGKLILLAQAWLYCQNRRLKMRSDVIFHSYLSLWDHQIWFSASLFYSRNNLAWTYTDHSNPKTLTYLYSWLFIKPCSISKLLTVIRSRWREAGWPQTHQTQTLPTSSPRPPPNLNQAFIKCF